LNKICFWYASAFLTGWLLMNVMLNIMRDESNMLLYTIPGLLAAIGWVYAEYRLEWRD